MAKCDPLPVNGADQLLIARRYPTVEAGLAYLDLFPRVSVAPEDHVRPAIIIATDLDQVLAEARARRAQRLYAAIAKCIDRLRSGGRTRTAWRRSQ